MIDSPWIRIVIVTFNSGEYTQACLNALSNQTESGFEVVVVDNQSSDGAIGRLRLPDSRFSIIELSENIGFSAGSNLGFRHASTPYLMTVNPDTFLDTRCLEALLRATKYASQHCMFSPVLFKSSEESILDGAGDSFSIFGFAWRNGGDHLKNNYSSLLVEPFEVFSPTGAAALYERRLFERVGGFDEKFFCYLEDVDLGLRLRAHGGSCLLVPDAKGTHIAGHSSDLISGFATKLSVQNNLRLIVRNAPVLLLPFMLTFFVILHFRYQFHNVESKTVEYRKAGFTQGLKNIPSCFWERFRRPRYPFGASLTVAHAIGWSISNLRTRSLKVIKNRH